MSIVLSGDRAVRASLSQLLIEVLMDPSNNLLHAFWDYHFASGAVTGITASTSTSSSLVYFFFGKRDISDYHTIFTEEF